MVEQPHVRSEPRRRPRVRAGGRPLLVAVLAVTAGVGACDRRERAAPAEPEPLLALTVETPEALDWGGSGTLRLTLANEGDFAAEGGIVEVFVPAWLEFGMVEPVGTAVTVVSGDHETRLSYQLTDSLPPGDRRTVVQHLRVHYQPAAAPLPADTLETVQLAPANQVVRARLLTARGEPTGAEVQATLHFVGGSGSLPPAGRTPDDTVPRGPGDTVPRVPGDTVPRGPGDTVPPQAPLDTLPAGGPGQAGSE
jgi:hypothetical protein